MRKIEVRKCHVEHIRYIAPQPGDEYTKAIWLKHPEYMEALAENESWSVWAGPRCIFAAGIMPLGANIGCGWAIIGKDAGPYMLQITKAVRKVFDESEFDRIEFYVDCDFIPGHKWARLLGMTMEAARMRKHGLTGNDEALYARVK